MHHGIAVLHGPAPQDLDGVQEAVSRLARFEWTHYWCCHYFWQPEDYLGASPPEAHPLGLSLSGRSGHTDEAEPESEPEGTQLAAW